MRLGARLGLASFLMVIVQPGLSAQPAQLHFSMTPTSWVFRAGHRVRLSIVNSVGRGYQSPPGVDRSSPPELAVLRDRRHASSLVLPVIPTG